MFSHAKLNRDSFSALRIPASLLSLFELEFRKSVYSSLILAGRIVSTSHKVENLVIPPPTKHVNLSQQYFSNISENIHESESLLLDKTVFTQKSFMPGNAGFTISYPFHLFTLLSLNTDFFSEADLSVAESNILIS